MLGNLLLGSCAARSVTTTYTSVWVKTALPRKNDSGSLQSEGEVEEAKWLTVCDASASMDVCPLFLCARSTSSHPVSVKKQQFSDEGRKMRDLLADELIQVRFMLYQC